MNNNEACNYDGGDCCGTRAIKKFCLDCKCICKNSVLQFIYLVHSDTFYFLNIRFYVLSWRRLQPRLLRGWEMCMPRWLSICKGLFYQRMWVWFLNSFVILYFNITSWPTNSIDSPYNKHVLNHNKSHPNFVFEFWHNIFCIFLHSELM